MLRIDPDGVDTDKQEEKGNGKTTREEALRWAIDDLCPGWALDSESTAPSLGALRGAVLGMHREIRVARCRASRAEQAGRRSGAL